MTPSAIPVLNKTGIELVMEAGAGAAAGFRDSEYTEKGVKIATREQVFASADALLQVRAPGANPEAGAADIAMMRPGQTVTAIKTAFRAVELIAKYVVWFAVWIVSLLGMTLMRGVRLLGRF